MFTLLALLAFFLVTGFKDLNRGADMWDLVRGVSCFVVAVSLVFGRGVLGI